MSESTAASNSRDDLVWLVLAVTIGTASLVCYFFSSVIKGLPWEVGRLLFYGFGPTLALSAFCFGRLLRRLAGQRPLFEFGILSIVIAGVVVNLMAVIQDSNFTVMHERILEAELEATKDDLRRVLMGVNNVQLSLDISFDIWIATGCFCLALGALFYFRQRWFGGLGALIGAWVLGVNLATVPTPPADVGLLDPGPFAATWLGCMLAVTAWRYRRDVLR